MSTSPENQSLLATLLSVLRPSRPVGVVFVVLVLLVLQHFFRRVIAGYTTTWFETGLPFRLLDRVMEIVLAPVQSVVNVLYDPWSPDWAFLLVTFVYFYALAIVIGTAYERIAHGV